jgi:UDP-2,3-diacylglucosamine pyrophosphatase LpxH
VSWDLYEQTYSGLSELLGERNCDLYVVRGNHDNPRYFDGKFRYDHIIFVKDYSVIPFSNVYNVLFIGGGVSVDRTYRTRHNIGHWKNEIVDIDITKLDNLEPVDIVVTHSNTTFAFPNSASPSSVVNYWRKFDKELWNDIVLERRYMTTVYDKLKINEHPIRLWVYGHYHNSYTQMVDSTEFKLLNINEWYKFK